jgi:tetratricopeptide (TPR) repeat protein
MESNSQTTWDIQFGNSGFNTWSDVLDSTNRIDLYRFIQFVEFNDEFDSSKAKSIIDEMSDSLSIKFCEQLAVAMDSIDISPLQGYLAPDNSDSFGFWAHYFYCELLLLKADYDVAEISIKREIERTPNFKPYQALLGEVYFQKRDFLKAEKIFADVLNQYSNDRSLHYYMDCLAEQGKNDSVRNFLSSHTVNPEMENYFRGLVSFNEFQPEVAIEYLRGCLSTSYDEHARYIIGWAYLDLGQIEMAKSVFIEGFAIHKSVNSLIPLINVHIQLYELNEALMYLGKNRLFFESPFLLGYFYIIDNLKLDNNQLALDKAAFEKFLNDCPKSKEDTLWLVELNHILIVKL